MIDRKPRFSRNQTISNIGMLLFELIDMCMKLLRFELYGAAYKRGLDPINGEFKEHRKKLAIAAVELLQEVGMSKTELAQVWDDAAKAREEERKQKTNGSLV